MGDCRPHFVYQGTGPMGEEVGKAKSKLCSAFPRQWDPIWTDSAWGWSWRRGLAGSGTLVPSPLCCSVPWAQVTSRVLGTMAFPACVCLTYCVLSLRRALPMDGGP